MRASVYLLKDPRNGEVRYVGCSTNPTSRLSAHASSTNNLGKGEWISELKQLGLKPFIEIVKSFDNADDASKEEQYQYSLYNNGNLLCNDPNIFRYQKPVPTDEMTTLNLRLSPDDHSKLLQLTKELGNSSVTDTIRRFIRSTWKSKK